jgi:DNA topoisomerase VI subunit B
VASDVLVEARWRDGLLHLAVEDNGPGLAPWAVQRILNFDTRTSDKTVYRAPTRGAQGNALKTIIGIPYVLGSQEPVIIEAQGVRHSIKPRIDPAGGLHLGYTTATVQRWVGTRVHVALPQPADEPDHSSPLRWARAFALFNPHVTVRIAHDGACSHGFNHGDGNGGTDADSYQATGCHEPTFCPENR